MGQLNNENGIHYIFNNENPVPKQKTVQVHVDK